MNPENNVLSCNCLNIVIELETNEYTEVFPNTLNLSKEELQNDFFQLELQQISKLKSINKQHTSLVHSYVVGSWIIHYCISCCSYTHAIHKERGANCVLVTKNLLSDPLIEELQKGDHFSNVFNIVINLEQEDSGSNQNTEVLPADVELALNNIKRLATESINRETLLVEERIRKFTERENALLEAFRERTRKEQSILSRLLLNNKVNVHTAMQSVSPVILPHHQIQELPPQHQSKFKKEKNPHISDNSSSSSSPNVIASKKLKSNPQKPKNVNDSEGLFQLDEVEDLKGQTFSENCDSSDNEDLFKEERYRPTQVSTNLAKSLPISIPIFMSATGGGRVSEEDKEDLLNTSDDVNPSDIAASIKALAKSVHGDAVFGDLPRPRICNQF